MKKIVYTLALLLILSSCSGRAERVEKPLVITSFYAMYDFAQAIAGDRAEVRVLVPAGSEPHSWEPTAKDMAALADADLFICSGAGMEPFARGLIDAAGNSGLIYVEASEGVALLPGDPHVWLDPRNAIIQHEAICNALCEADPENGDFYTERFETAKTEIEKLHADYLETVSGFKSKDIVVSHSAFGYLCEAYGLSQLPIAGMSAEGEPSPAQMAEIVEFIRSSGARAIFTEELLSTKVAETIAHETGAEIYTLTPFESGETDYVTAMRANLDNLKKALG